MFCPDFSQTRTLFIHGKMGTGSWTTEMSDGRDEIEQANLYVNACARA